MQGWLFGKNVECDFLNKMEGSLEVNKEETLYTNLNNKFYNDTINNKDGMFLEGYIVNRNELMNMSESNAWEDAYSMLVKKKEFPGMLRGSFCGFHISTSEILFFTDHIGSKALYYYLNNNVIIVATNLTWIVEVLKHNGIPYTFNKNAAKYMLTYGFMLDNSTFISEIKRVMPGEKLCIANDIPNIIQYYKPSIQEVEDISEDEAIQKIDIAFRRAVKREFEKDKEYGYDHLVDLSGGLDSRMVTWVAHDMGYCKQTNYSYCKRGYLDYRISSKIARDLKHEYYFKQLDDFQWIYELEPILQLSNGSALYSGITGGKDCLENFNREKYGIEHTGMIGDVIISSFSSNKEKAYKKPTFGTNQYSTSLIYDFSNSILDKYENQEIFDLYVRGFLGAMSTYPIRQNYFEVSSPFLDVDFMDTCFKLPIEYRAKHKIYLKWIKEYYPNATKYGWEKWAGVWPRKELYLLVIGKFVLRKIYRTIRILFKQDINDNMNPINYWYAKDTQAQAFFNNYFNENIRNDCLGAELREDITKLFKEGTANEKTQVLTVLGMAKLFFG